jgi:4-hydroxybenzoyl-CoA thioesterase
MARIKLGFPEPMIYSTDLHVRVDDINYGGHVGNDRFLTLIQEARLRLFRDLGYKDEASIQDKTGIIVTDAAVVYKSELFLGDKVQIDISISYRNKYGFDFFYRINNLMNNKISAIIKTGVVGYDYGKSKVVPFPEEFFERLKNRD